MNREDSLSELSGNEKGCGHRVNLATAFLQKMTLLGLHNIGSLESLGTLGYLKFYSLSLL